MARNSSHPHPWARSLGQPPMVLFKVFQATWPQGLLWYLMDNYSPVQHAIKHQESILVSQLVAYSWYSLCVVVWFLQYRQTSVAWLQHWIWRWINPLMATSLFIHGFAVECIRIWYPLGNSWWDYLQHFGHITFLVILLLDLASLYHFHMDKTSSSPSSSILGLVRGRPTSSQENLPQSAHLITESEAEAAVLALPNIPLELASIMSNMNPRVTAGSSVEFGLDVLECFPDSPEARTPTYDPKLEALNLDAIEVVGLETRRTQSQPPNLNYTYPIEVAEEVPSGSVTLNASTSNLREDVVIHLKP